MESPDMSEEKISKVLQLAAQTEDCKETLRSLQSQLAQLLEDTEAAEELFAEPSEELDDLESAEADAEVTDEEERPDGEWSEPRDSEAAEEERVPEDLDERPGTSLKTEPEPEMDDAAQNELLKKKILNLYKLTGAKGGESDTATQLKKIRAFIQEASRHFRERCDGGQPKKGPSVSQRKEDLQAQSKTRKQMTPKSQETLKDKGPQEEERRLLSPGGVQELPEWIVKLQKKLAMKTREQAGGARTPTAKPALCLPPVPFLYQSRIKARDPWPPALIREIVYRSERLHRPCRLANNPPSD